MLVVDAFHPCCLLLPQHLFPLLMSLPQHQFLCYLFTKALNTPQPNAPKEPPPWSINTFSCVLLPVDAPDDDDNDDDTIYYYYYYYYCICMQQLLVLSLNHNSNFRYSNLPTNSWISYRLISEWRCKGCFVNE
jgi:hypothetical protein